MTVEVEAFDVGCDDFEPLPRGGRTGFTEVLFGRRASVHRHLAQLVNGGVRTICDPFFSSGARISNNGVSVSKFCHNRRLPNSFHERDTRASKASV